jgi:hypothetical protein
LKPLLKRIDELDLGFWHFPDQVVRLMFLFALAIAALVVARCQFVPATFGEEGHYRSSARKAIAAGDIRYAGWQTCMECHEDEGEAKQRSFHRNLSCEVCHGPASDHAQAWMEGEDDAEALNPHIPSERDECLYCHRYLPSRPTGFPQVLALTHNPLKPMCTECHDPHDPTPPEVPEACAACHGQIASTKALSHHNVVGCEICHEASPEHRQQPRQHLPKKPTSRAFCGGCHAEGASPEVDLEFAGEIPQVDMSAHGGAYLCWQCHYPHHPEGGR